MTAFIRDEGLLDFEEIEAIVATAPSDLIAFQQVAATQPIADRQTMQTWLERFNQGAKLIAAHGDR